MDEGLVVFFAAIAIVLGAGGGCLAGVRQGVLDQREAAVQQGHAEYYIGTNYQREWRWKTNGCKAVTQ